MCDIWFFLTSLGVPLTGTSQKKNSTVDEIDKIKRKREQRRIKAQENVHELNIITEHISQAFVCKAVIFSNQSFLLS